jgi:sugar lactone lactonase YvrE
MSDNHRFNSIVRRWRLLFVTFATLCLIRPVSARATTLFVSDAGNDVIHGFDAGTGLAIMPDIPLLGVTGLATGPNGDLFAVTSNPPQVYRYNPTTGAQIGGAYVTYNGQNDGHDVYGPNGMAFAPNGNLYIADTTSSPITSQPSVHVYDTAGNSVASMGSPELSQPTDVAFDGAGNLYVVNPGNANVLVSVGGTQPLAEFFATQTGGLTIPSALTFGPNGELYVLDSSNDNGPAIRRYTAAGAADGTVLSYATTLFQPNDIAFGPDGKLYVSGIDLSLSAGQVLRYLPDGTADGALITSGPSYPTFMTFSVPEPATLVLMMIAGAMLLVRRR